VTLRAVQIDEVPKIYFWLVIGWGEWGKAILNETIIQACNQSQYLVQLGKVTDTNLCGRYLRYYYAYNK